MEEAQKLCQSAPLRSHDRVDVISQRGRVRNVELRLTEIIGPGQLFMPFHFFETNVNEVTQSAFTGNESVGSKDMGALTAWVFTGGGL